MIDTRLTAGFQDRNLATAAQARRTVGHLRRSLGFETWAQRLRMRTALSLRGRIAHKAKLRAPRAARHRAIYAASPLSAEPPRKQPHHNKHNCTKITGCLVSAVRRRRRAPIARPATARRHRRPEVLRPSATRATEFQTAPRRRASGHQPEARGGRARARRRRAALLQIGSSPTGRAWTSTRRTTLYLL